MSRQNKRLLGFGGFGLRVVEGFPHTISPKEGLPLAERRLRDNF